MKRLLFAFIISLFFGILIPNVLAVKIYPNLVNTLYTVAGIFFSVGMSLVVTISTQNIRNQEAKKEVQSKVHDLLVQYVMYFISLTLCFILLPSIHEQESYKDLNYKVGQFMIQWNYSLSYLILLLFLVGFFVYNMMKVRSQNNKIEQIVDSEQSAE